MEIDITGEQMALLTGFLRSLEFEQIASHTDNRNDALSIVVALERLVKTLEEEHSAG